MYWYILYPSLGLMFYLIFILGRRIQGKTSKDELFDLPEGFVAIVVLIAWPIAGVAIALRYGHLLANAVLTNLANRLIAEKQRNEY